MGNSQSVLRDLVEYRTDVAVVARVDDDRRFHAVPYARQRVVVFVPRGHEWARRRGIRLAELEGRPMVLREEGSLPIRLSPTPTICSVHPFSCSVQVDISGDAEQGLGRHCSGF